MDKEDFSLTKEFTEKLYVYYSLSATRENETEIL
jgi:hypothetical protein